MDDVREDLLPAAVVVGVDGLELVEVDEVEGVLVARASGAALELDLVVVVVGLEELEVAS